LYPIPQDLKSRNKIFLDIDTMEIRLDKDVYPLDNVSAGMILKIMVKGDDVIPFKPGLTQYNGYTIYYRPIEITPPQLMATAWEVFSTQPLRLDEAYNTVLKWVEETIYHPLDVAKELITLYILYTWFSRYYPKKVFLIVSGMYMTGKSQVGALLKAFGRYTVQTFVGAKTSEWELALLKGTMLIDEPENLTRKHLAWLRRLHDEGYIVSKMMGAPGGWRMVSLQLDSPVVLIGTHIPEDPALISRSLIIKMHYGEPRSKPPTINSQLAREFRASMLLSSLRYYSDYQKAIRSLEGYKPRKPRLSQRELDLFIPLAAILKIVGREDIERDLAYMLAYSRYLAYNINPAKRLLFNIIREIIRNGSQQGEFICISQQDLLEIVSTYAKASLLERETIRYIIRYLDSSSYILTKGEVKYCFRKEDLEVQIMIEEDVIDYINSLLGLKP